jgi:hypothetical protein
MDGASTPVVPAPAFPSGLDKTSRSRNALLESFEGDPWLHTLPWQDYCGLSLSIIRE